MTQPTYSVIEFAFVDDDGTESGSTLGTPDVDITMQPGTAQRRRVRFQIQNTNNKSGIEGFDWEYSRNSGTWTPITITSSYVRAIGSAFGTPPADGDNCTNRLTSQGGSFDGTNSGWTDTGVGTTDTFDANAYWEVELCFYLIEEGDSSTGDTLDIRVQETGGDTTTVTDPARATLDIPTPASDSQSAYTAGVDTTSDNNSAYIEGVAPTGTIQQSYWQIRDDDTQSLNSGTFAAAINTAAEVNVEQVFRVRFEFEELLSFSKTVSIKFQWQKNGAGGWTDFVKYPDDPSTATATNGIDIVSSSQYADGAATTNVMTGSAKTFVAGTGEEDNTIASITLNNQHTEVEVAFIMRAWYDGSGQNVDADYYEIRAVETDDTILGGSYALARVNCNVPDYLIGGTFVETPNRMLVADTNGNLYTVIEDSETDANFILLKSADGGKTWTRPDSAGAPTTIDIEAVDMVIGPAGTLNIVTRSLTSSTERTFYHRFRMSDHATTQDDWEIIDEIITTSPVVGQSCSIEYRSDGSLVAFYTETVSSFERVSYKIRNGSWSTATNLDAEASTDFAHVTTVKGASDLIHIFYSDTTNGIGYHRSLSSADSLSGREVFESNLGAAFSYRAHVTTPVYWDDSGEENIMIGTMDANTPSSNYLYSVVIKDDGTPETRKQISTNPVAYNHGTNDQVVADLGADGMDVHAFFAPSADNDIYRDVATNDGGWGTDTEEQDGVTAHWLRGHVFTHSAGNGSAKVFGYIWDDGSDGYTGYIYYSEYELGTATADSQSAYVAGGINVSDNQAAYVEGVSAGTNADDSQSAYIAGSINVSDNQAAYMAGSINVSDSQAAYLLGSINVADNQAAYVEGEAAVNGVDIFNNWGRYRTTATLNAYARSIGNATDISDASLLVKFKPNDLTTQSTLRFVIRGSRDWASNVTPTKGYEVEFENDGSTVTVNRIESGSRTQIDTFSNTPTTGWRWLRFEASGTDIMVRVWLDGAGEPGVWDSDVDDSISGFTTAGTVQMSLETSSAGVPHTAHLDDLTYDESGTLVSDNQAAFIKGQATVSDSQTAYIAGSIDASDNQAAFLLGSLGATDSQSAYVVGVDTASDNQSAYIAGSTTASDSQPAYIKAASAVGFDASGDTANRTTGLPTLTGDSDKITVAGWIKFRDITPGAYAVSLILGDSGLTNHIYIGITSSDVGVLRSGATNDVWSPQPSQDVWYYMYIIGENDGAGNIDWDAGYYAATSSTPIDTANISSQTEFDPTNLWIAGTEFGDPTDMVSAYMRVWDTALTEAELRAERDSAVAVKSANLHADWPMAGNAFTDDISGNGRDLTFSGTVTDELGPTLEDNVIDNQSAYAHGQLSISDSQPAYVQGQLGVSDSQAAYTAGTDTASASQAAYMVGGLNVTDNQAAYIEGGAILASDNKAAYMAGTATAADNKSAYTIGSIDVADNQAAYLKGQATASDNQAAYLKGQATASDNQAAYLKGQATALGSQVAYTAGGINVAASQLAYIAGTATASNSQPAYTAGGVNVSDNQAAFIQGQDTASDSQAAYVAGGVNVVDNQAAYVAGTDTASDNQAAYIEGESGTQSNVAAYIKGVDTAADSQSAYVAGGINVTDNQAAFIQGQDTASDSQAAYVVGGINAADNQAAYIAGTDTASDSQAAFISGLSEGEVSNVPAFVQGQDTAVDNKSAYVAGGINVLDNQAAYLIGSAAAVDNQAAYVAGVDVSSDSKGAYVEGLYLPLPVTEPWTGPDDDPWRLSHWVTEIIE